MKRKIAILLMTAGVILGTTACGGETDVKNAENKRAESVQESVDKENDKQDKKDKQDKADKQDVKKAVSEVMTVTIAGNAYDLSGDFKQAVGQMTTDGLIIANKFSMNVKYDENGEQVRATMKDVQGAINGYEKALLKSVSPVVKRGFSWTTVEVDEFKPKDGINGFSTAEDIRKLDGYTVYGDDSYCCAYGMYVDGKLVDLKEYRDEYDAWYKDAKELGVDKAFLKHFSETDSYYAEKNSASQEDAVSRADSEAFRVNLMFIFAANEAGKALETGGIECYDLIIYDYTDNQGVGVTYHHYYLDEEFTEYDVEKRKISDETRQKS